MEIERATLVALTARAARQAPETPEEHRALADARELLADDFAAQFPVTTGSYEQPTLFDPASYKG